MNSDWFFAGAQSQQVMPTLGNKDTDMEILKATPEHAEEITLLNDAVQKIRAEHHPRRTKGSKLHI